MSRRPGPAMLSVVAYVTANPGCIKRAASQRSHGGYATVDRCARAGLIVLVKAKSKLFGQPIYLCYLPGQVPNGS